MNQDLKIIKKKYGERMMKLCRELFPTMLEKEGLLSQLMLDHFEPSHTLYDDIVLNELEDEFKNYIYSLINVEKKEKIVTKSPKELLEEAGYDLFECHTEEEIQSFKRYYQKDEELCTFNGNRLERCYVFFAVKKDVDNIKREEFKTPEREDLYGTSVISIQFTKDETHTLSIKNRYNHTVNNPDATFSNNLDNIVEGLTESFASKYGMIQADLSGEFEIPNYVKENNGKYYKYNYEINNIYYCTNNVIIDNFEVKKLKHNELLLDYFILDLQDKRITLYDDSIEDSFIDGLQDVKQIQIMKENEDKKIIIKTSKEDAIIKIDDENKIIEYQNNNISRIEDNFLIYNSLLDQIELLKVTEIGNDFLYYNESLTKMEIPRLEKVGMQFLFNNLMLLEVEFLNLKMVDSCFLYSNGFLAKVRLPSVEEIKDNFLACSRLLNEIDLPNVKEIGNYFLSSNQGIKKLELPNVERIGRRFLYSNENIKELYLPKVEKIGSSFLYFNKKIEKLNLSNVTEVEDDFLYSNESLVEINLQNLPEEYYSYLNLYTKELILSQKVKTKG